MLSSLKLAADHVDIASAILKLESKGLFIANRSFGVVGEALNVSEMFDANGNFTWNWEDGGQAGLALTLFL